MTQANSRIDHSRLLRDPEYLLQAVAAQFQKVDTYHRGLITSSNFSKALESLGLRYGQPEVEDVLRYCTVTDDGYVHYKELLHIVAPGTPRAKQSTMKGTIYPPTNDLSPSEPSASEAGPARERDGFFASRTEDIRKVFSKWERGYISDHQFKEVLRNLGIPLTEELDRLFVTYGPARTMPFSKLMYALQIESNDGRRARNALGVPAAPSRLGAGAPTAWGSRQHSEMRYHGESGSASVASQSEVSSHTVPPSGLDDLSTPHSLRQAICDFVDGNIPAVTFRVHLQRFDVPLTPQLDKLIRTHESDNSVRFQDLARLMLRQESDRSSGGGAATPRNSAAGSVQGSVRTAQNGEAMQAPGSRDNRQMFAPPSRASYTSSVRSGASSAVPYAAGGNWSEDGRSVASQSECSRRPPSATGSSSRGLEPPWATGQSQSRGQAQRNSQDVRHLHSSNHSERPQPSQSSQRSYPSERQPRANSASRAQGHHGDILGWNGPASEESAHIRGRRQVYAPSRDNQPSSFLQWQDSNNVATDPRSGKRLYGGRISASDFAPFGRSTDVHEGGDGPHVLSSPFGTDQDLHLRRPEDAGTDEYRSASAVRRLGKR